MVEQTRCRTCEAPIFMLRHQYTGNVAPIDAEPKPDGNCAIDLEAGTYSIIVTPKGKKAAERDGVQLHWPHFGTCPDRAAWRRGR